MHLRARENADTWFVDLGVVAPEGPSAAVYLTEAECVALVRWLLDSLVGIKHLERGL